MHWPGVVKATVFDIICLVAMQCKEDLTDNAGIPNRQPPSRSVSLTNLCFKPRRHHLEAHSFWISIFWTKSMVFSAGLDGTYLDGDIIKFSAVNWCRLSFTENNAISVLENSQAPWSCIGWSRTCRQAPQTSWRSWSCWWSTSSSVRTSHHVFVHCNWISDFQNQLW